MRCALVTASAFSLPLVTNGCAVGSTALAFYGIGLKGAGDIGALAPGLAAALINTSMGLFVAIPAVIAYNYFSDKIRGIATRMDSFSMEFLGFIERNLLRRKP